MILRQLLPLMVMPLAVALALLLFAVIRRRRWPIVAAVVVLWVSSLPVVSDALMRGLQGRQQRQPAAAAPLADAIVVLSTGRTVAPGPARISEWSDADRFFAGVALFKAQRAPLLVFTGGASPFDPEPILEGDVLISHAEAMGIPREQMATTSRVTNTAEEAAAVRTLLGARSPKPVRVLLVTSAFHMSRASRLFARAGFEVEAFPVDFAAAGSNGIGIFDLFPTADALGQTQRSLREFYGRLYYQLAPSAAP